MSAVSNVTGNSRFTATFNEIVSAGVVAAYSIPATLGNQPSYTNAASGANTIDLVYAKQLTLATTSIQDLLSGMTGLNGEALVFARVREFIIQVVDTTASHFVNVFAVASTGWTVGLPLVAEQLTVAAGGVLHMSDPLSTGASTGLYVAAAHGGFELSANTTGTVVNVIIAGNSVA